MGGKGSFICLNYHGLFRPGETLDPAVDDPVYTLPVERFGEHLDLVLASGAKVVSLCEARSGAVSGAAPVVVITFDDGRSSDYLNAFPELAKRGLRAVFFLVSAWVGRPGWLSWAQVAEMSSAGMEFASHGHTHRFLEDLETGELREELRRSKETLEQGLGREVDLLAFPGGRFSGKVLKAAREAGFRAFATSIPGRNAPGADIIQRMAVKSSTPAERLRGLLAGAPLAMLKEQAAYWAFWAGKRAVGNERYERLRGAILSRRTAR